MGHIVLTIRNIKGDKITLYESVDKIYEKSVEVLGFVIQRKNIRFEKGFYWADVDV